MLLVVASATKEKCESTTTICSGKTVMLQFWSRNPQSMKVPDRNVSASSPCETQSSRWKWLEWSEQDQIAFSLGLAALAAILIPCIFGLLYMFS